MANKYGSDKGTKVPARHGYTEFYYHILRFFRKNRIKLLEIGVREGHSLLMWHDFFPNAEIVGMDIKKSSKLKQERIKTFKGDQSSIEDLQRLIDLYGSGYFIIIDDGSHKSEDQKISFEFLKPHMCKGGYYFIEDLQAKAAKTTQEVVSKDPEWTVTRDKKLGVYCKK